MRRPSCLRCITSNRACTGYGRDLIFVNRTPSNPSSTATSVLSEIKAQQQLKDARTEANLHYLFSEFSHNSHDFRHYAVELLKATYLPKKPVSNSCNAETSVGSFSWVCRLTDLMEPSKSLDTALFPFCLAQLHVTGIGNASLYQCLDQYHTALQHLYSDLDHPERRFREETLAAFLVLSTCEVCTEDPGKHLNETVSFKFECYLNTSLSPTQIALLTKISSSLYVLRKMAGAFTHAAS